MNKYVRLDDAESSGLHGQQDYTLVALSAAFNSIGEPSERNDLTAMWS